VSDSNHDDTLPAIPATDWDPQDWDDDTLASLKRDPEPSRELVLHGYTQTAWDRRKVHQLRQVEKVLDYLQTHLSQETGEATARGAVILLAEPGAGELERTLGVRPTPEGIAAYLAQSPAAAPTIAAPAKPVCPVCGQQRARLQRHLRRMHPGHTAEGEQ
jgi:hypothetical protein